MLQDVSIVWGARRPEALFYPEYFFRPSAIVGLSDAEVPDRSVVIMLDKGRIPLRPDADAKAAPPFGSVQMAEQPAVTPASQVSTRHVNAKAVRAADPEPEPGTGGGFDLDTAREVSWRSNAVQFPLSAGAVPDPSFRRTSDWSRLSVKRPDTGQPPTVTHWFVSCMWRFAKLVYYVNLKVRRIRHACTPLREITQSSSKSGRLSTPLARLQPIVYTVHVYVAGRCLRASSPRQLTSARDQT